MRLIPETAALARAYATIEFHDNAGIYVDEVSDVEEDAKSNEDVNLDPPSLQNRTSPSRGPEAPSNKVNQNGRRIPSDAVIPASVPSQDSLDLPRDENGCLMMERDPSQAQWSQPDDWDVSAVTPMKLPERPVDLTKSLDDYDIVIPESSLASSKDGNIGNEVRVLSNKPKIVANESAQKNERQRNKEKSKTQSKRYLRGNDPLPP